MGSQVIGVLCEKVRYRSLNDAPWISKTPIPLPSPRSDRGFISLHGLLDGSELADTGTRSEEAYIHMLHCTSTFWLRIGSFLNLRYGGKIV